MTIGYVTEVKNENESKSMRFFIPTTVAPRYVSPSEKSDPKAQELAHMTFSYKSPAPLSIKVAACFQGQLQSIESPTHKIKVDGPKKMAEKQGNWFKGDITLDAHTTDMDRDFVLIITPEEHIKPRLYSEVQLHN